MATSAQPSSFVKSRQVGFELAIPWKVAGTSGLRPHTRVNAELPSAALQRNFKSAIVAGSIRPRWNRSRRSIFV